MSKPKLTWQQMDALASGLDLAMQLTSDNHFSKCVGCVLHEIKIKAERKLVGGRIEPNGYVLKLSPAQLEAIKWLNQHPYRPAFRVEMMNAIFRLINLNQ